MKIVCLVVGKKHDPELVSAIEKYQTRLTAYVPFEFEYIASSDKTSESESILNRLKSTDSVMLLDETGTVLSNHQLAQTLESMQNRALKRLVIIVGGTYGVEDSVKSRSDQIVSLSKLVFPHQIVRLLVVEQLYRSFNILVGGKYHHDE